MAQEEAQVRVLVVDDEVASQIIMKSILNSHCCVDVASNGSEAVEFFVQSLDDKRPYDLIFMDIIMPEMDGQEALRNIRRIEKENKIDKLKETAVVMLTILDDPKSVVEAYHSGEATFYLTKPATRQVIEKIVNDLGVLRSFSRCR
ncbi:MAG: response regulator [Solidesulfovibrio sp.]|uniref:response regulator n=1 Tax=Solidesulfovibrio sp. TaxID=2910990 RepID=UPI003158DFD9